MKIIPHRIPFILIDRVVHLDEVPPGGKRAGRKVTAIKNVTMNEPFFAGHFPHRPVMPGVLIVEAMAQACAIACHVDGDPEMDVSIASINGAKFRKPVVPGDTLELRGEFVKEKGPMLLLKSEAYVENQLVAEANLMAYVVPKSESRL